MFTNMWIIPKETRQSAMLFKSLGDPARLNLLALLATEGEMFVGQMCERTGYTQPAISSQLRMAHDGLQGGAIRRPMSDPKTLLPRARTLWMNSKNAR
jgi:DNA-binding transcriptional ArsR family regulator